MAAMNSLQHTGPMRIRFTPPTGPSIETDFPALPSKGDLVTLRGTRYTVETITWHPDGDDTGDPFVNVDLEPLEPLDGSPNVH